MSKYAHIADAARYGKKTSGPSSFDELKQKFITRLVWNIEDSEVKLTFEDGTFATLNGVRGTVLDNPENVSTRSIKSAYGMYEFIQDVRFKKGNMEQFFDGVLTVAEWRF